MHILKCLYKNFAYTKIVDLKKYLKIIWKH